MAKKALPAPGYYRSGDKDVIVLDPASLGDTPAEDGPALLTKDGDDARWSPAVAFRLAFQPSPLYVLSAEVFDHRFHETTREEALQRVQAAEMLRDKQAGDAERATGLIETTDGEAIAEGPTAETVSPQ